MIESSSDDTVTQPLLDESDRRFSHDSSEDDDILTTRTLSPFTCLTASKIRLKFFLAGFLFGGLMELLYVHCIRMGYAKLEQTSPSEYSIRMDSWSDVLVYEMSFLCSDVVLLLYLVILARSIMYRNLTLNLAIQAANWTVGMILGFSAAVTSIVGTQTMLEYSGLEVLGNLAVGTLLCLLAYALAVAIQVQCLFPQPDADDEKARDSTMLVAAQFV